MKEGLVADPDAVGVGTPRRRQDAYAKVRGEFEYAPDLTDPQMLWGATLRSPHPHALIKRVNLDPAKQMPGVRAVLGAWDVPKNSFGMIVADTPVLADDRVRYVGEPVAIVAAEDPVLARRAVAAIEVEYEVLAAVLDPVQALDAGAVYRHVKYTHGDPAAAGEVQAEGEYVTARQDHAFLAPDAGIARPDGRGGVEIIGAAQWVHADRPQIAAALGLPEEMVLVRNSGVGGSFGGRVSIIWQLHGALLALHTGRPVKFLYTREETMLARYHRHPSRIWLRHHATRDGRLVKLEAKILLEDGPYEHASGAGIGNSCSMIQGPYSIPNASVEGWSVATNNGMCGSMRGFGVVEPMFACESNMDNLARILGMDGAELRRINAIQRGDRWIFNQLQDRPTPTHPVMTTAAAMPLPDEAKTRHPVDRPGGVASPARPEYVRRGVGFAAAAKNVCLSEGAQVNSTAMVCLRDGEAVIECAAAEVGQGFVNAAVQIAQSTLGVTKVRIGGVATDMAPAATTDGQQQTMTSGPAVDRAAAAVKAQFLRFYGREYGVDPTDLDIAQDYVVDRAGRRLKSVAEAGMGLVFRATERFDQRPTRPLEERDNPDPVHVTLDFSANRCVVDVDVELGLVKVVQMDVAQDVGRVVNPIAAHGQICGGSVMGMGLALMENLHAEGGHLLNTDFSTYLIPTSVDVPVINTRFVEEPEPGISYGIKGMAELPHVQSPPAVLSALRAATGRALPVAPATAEMLAGVVDSDQSMTLVDVGMTPLEFRRRNVVKPGDNFAVGGAPVDDCLGSYGLDQCLDAVGGAIEAGPSLPVPDGPEWSAGVGYAMSMYDTAPPTEHRSEASVELLPDGTYLVRVGTCEFGNGTTTSHLQFAAAALGTGMDRVAIRHGDTAESGWDTGAFAQTGLFVAGRAVARAAQGLRDRIIDYAERLADDGERVALLAESVTVGDRRITLEELWRRADADGVALSQSRKAYGSPVSVGFNVTGVCAAVNSITGEIRLLQVAHAVDAGRVINPQQLRGQVEGGVTMGIGFAMTEWWQMDDRGTVRNPGIRMYRIPNFADVPPIQVFFAGDEDTVGPFGAKGCAESPIDPVAPAIANAVADATGVRLRDLPLVPPLIFKQLYEAYQQRTGVVRMEPT